MGLGSRFSLSVDLMINYISPTCFNDFSQGREISPFLRKDLIAAGCKVISYNQDLIIFTKYTTVFYYHIMKYYHKMNLPQSLWMYELVEFSCLYINICCLCWISSTRGVNYTAHGPNAVLYSCFIWPCQAISGSWSLEPWPQGRHPAWGPSRHGHQWQDGKWGLWDTSTAAMSTASCCVPNLACEEPKVS